MRSEKSSRMGAALDAWPSGDQYEITWRDQRATIVAVGGGIREYAVGGRPVLDPYALDAMCDGAHGAPLIPWPNRLADGRYRFDGVNHQVALTEPKKHNAIHGFLRWRPWQVRHQAKSQVAMETRLFPMPGYPFLLDIEVDYALGEPGLTVVTTAANLGVRTCPYGAGHHPYLSPGVGLVDDCTLQLEAAKRIVTDEGRQLPTGIESVGGTIYDFREAKLLGAQRLDFAFTDLARDGDGRAWARLGGSDGQHAELWVDASYPIIELYTGDTLPLGRRRLGLGTEPMTCPPNAFASGDGVIHLEPGQAVTTTCGARLT
jgi:aldose 1-epimerase